MITRWLVASLFKAGYIIPKTFSHMLNIPSDSLGSNNDSEGSIYRNQGGQHETQTL